MLRLSDARTRELTDVLPAGRRHLRILVSAPGQVRAYLAADLLRRAAGRSGLLPEVTDLVPDGTAVSALRAACDALNVHPPAATLTPSDTGPSDTAPSSAAGMPPFDVAFGLADEPASDTAGLAPLWARVAGGSHEAELAEPLAVRLSLLRHGYGEPLGNHGASAADAEILGRWRTLVAQWARSPSGAISRPHADEIARAFADDLDSAAALATLDGLADDPDVPDGVKFETFAAADHLFGLDLAADIGK
jgi:hypothetical protein